jgi:general secretion pathway protein N
MKHVGRVCVVNLFLLGASAFGAASPGMTGTPDAGILEATRPPPPAPSSQDLPAAQTQQPPSGNPLWGIPFTQLSATRDRPIFSPSRRPPPPVVASPVAAVVETAVEKPKGPDRPRLSLLGTIVNGDDGFGIFMDQATAAPLRIRIGSDYQGWTLRFVRARSAMLQKGQEFMELALLRPAGDQNAVAGQLIAGTGARPPAPPPPQGSTTGQTAAPYLSPESASLRMPARPVRSPVRRQ